MNVLTDEYDIQIPTVYIKDDWCVDDIETLEDCEDAHVLLVSMCAAIELQIDELNAVNDTTGRVFRAKSALKWKKLALALVSSKKSQINRQNQQKKEVSRDKLVLTYIGTEHPDIIRDADNWAQAVMKRREIEETQ